MPEYSVNFTQTAGTTVQVEAETPDEAIEFAYEEVPYGLCHQCTGSRGRPGVELDGDWEPHSVYDTDYNLVWAEKEV